MDYKEELTKAMAMLAQDERTIFLGQSVAYSGQAMFATLEGVPMGRKIELPIFEDSQMGMSIGMSLMGFIPVSIFTRMNFLLSAMNQLVNHLDKIEEMSYGEFAPKVIIRTMVGSKTPLDGGLQHTGDYTLAIKKSVSTIDVYTIDAPYQVIPYYREALSGTKSCLMIEYEEKYAT